LDYSLTNLSIECAVCTSGDGIFEIRARDFSGRIHSVEIAEQDAVLPLTEFPNTDSGGTRFRFILGTELDSTRPCAGTVAVEGTVNAADSTVSLTFTSSDLSDACFFGNSGLADSGYVQSTGGSFSADVIVPISDSSTECAF